MLQQVNRNWTRRR